MKYKFLFFDADDTLFDFRRSEREAFMLTLEDFEVRYDKERCFKIYRDINNSLWLEFENGNVTQKELRIERFKRLFEKINESHNPEMFNDTYIEYLASSSFTYPEAEHIIARLSKKYKLAIVTNGIGYVQQRRIRKAILGKYFERIIVSEDIGVQKPESEFFEIALREMGIKDRSKVLLIGDSLTSDIQGGKNSGIDTCWYNPNNIKNTTNLKPKYEIHTLLELYDLL